MRITNLDAPSNIHWKPEVVHENDKKKYLQAYRTNAVTSLPFWFHVIGVLGNEAKVVLAILILDFTKFEVSDGTFLSFFRQMFCTRGSRIPTSRMSQQLQWEDGATPASSTIRRTTNKTNVSTIQ